MTKSSSSSGSARPNHSRRASARARRSGHARMEEDALLASAGAWTSIEVPHEGTRSRTRAPQFNEATVPAVRIAAYTNVGNGHQVPGHTSMYPAEIQFAGSTPMVRTSHTFHFTRPAFTYDPDPPSHEQQLAARQFTAVALADYHQPTSVNNNNNNNEDGDWVPEPICHPSVSSQRSAGSSGWVVVPAPPGDIYTDTEDMGTGVLLPTDNASYSTWDYLDQESETRGHHSSS